MKLFAFSRGGFEIQIWHWIICGSSPCCSELRLWVIYWWDMSSMFTANAKYSSLGRQWLGNLFHYSSICYVTTKFLKFLGSRCYLFLIFRVGDRVFLFFIFGHFDNNYGYGPLNVGAQAVIFSIAQRVLLCFVLQISFCHCPA